MATFPSNLVESEIQESDEVHPEKVNSMEENLAVDFNSYLNIDSSNDTISERTIQLADFLQRTSEQLRNRVKRYDDSIRQRRQKKKIPPRVAENIFIITCILQLLWVAAMQLVDILATEYVHKKNVWYVMGVVIAVIFQLSNLVLSLVVTVKLTKQYMHHTASTKFLLQSYLSTQFIFGGIYTFIAREWPTTFQNIQGSKTDKLYALRLYSQLLFTSISTGTLCGAATVVAIEPVTEILMASQMMLSFVYFASILSQVINPPLTKPTEITDSFVASMKKKIFKSRRNYKTFQKH